jgi:serine/threonine protein kinase
MATTISADSVTAPSESLRESIAKYSTGQYSKRDMTRVLSQAVEAEPGCCEAIQEFLDDRLHSRQMTTVDHRELSSILDSLTTEGLPTESSQETPVASGLYKIDGEGTLILASEKEKSEQQHRKSPEPEKPKAEPHPSTRLGRGSVLRERYRLEEEVARGSMGLVYRATDLLKLESGANSPTVAVKVINPEFSNNKAALRSFQNEVANTQHLSHPNIVNLFELDKCNDHYYITMEWLEGESLDALLDRSRGSALPPIQAYAIIEQLCDALIYAHEHRVVHADIKPGNVFLTKPGELKLIDFGIAHIEESLEAEAGKNKKSIALTPAYASCECLEKQRPTAQDDLFSLACLVYRLLSGRRVFGSMTALQAEAEGVVPVPIGGISQTRWRAIQKALAFRREDRYTDVQAFVDAFGRRETPREVVESPTFDAEIDDIKFTETANLELGEADIQQAFLSSPDLSSIVLDDEGSDLLGTSQLLGDEHGDLGFPSIDNALPSVPAPDQGKAGLPLELDSADLDQLPEPINFFDEDSDDSVFVPIESAAASTSASQPASGGTVPIENTVPTEATVPTESTTPFESFPAAESRRSPLTTPPSTRSAFAGNPAGLDDPLDKPAPPHVNPADWGYVAVPAQTPAQSSAQSSGSAQPSDQEAPKGKSAGAAPKAAKKTSAAATPVPAAGPSGRAIERLTRPVIHSASLSLPERALALFEERSSQAMGVAGALLLLVAAMTFTGDSPTDGDAQSPDTYVEASQPDAAQEEFIDAVIARPVTDAEILMGQADGQAGPVSGSAELPLNRADTGIALEGTAVPVIFGPQAGADAGASPATNMSEQMRELNDQAKRALQEGRLIGADTDNAAAWLDKMRASEPDIAFTRAIEAGLIAALIERAGQAVAEKDMESARYWTERAAEYGADDASLAKLSGSIAQLRAESRLSGGAATRSSGADSPAVELPISQLEFAHYQDPDYPRLFAESGVEGWVDVRFRVGPDGVPADIEIVGTNLPPRFAAPSATAVQAWRFVPHRVNGKAVPVISSARINYAD